ncbi:sphingomyelin phosphodiesterase [Pseudoalteromonas luteoviolacea]|uniref:sphingomyelin phosphodiesterase n=1 Tax=Pseudoalteromonas luteoviolacea TaxID=43657 RepID=UPI001FFDCB7B|nr:sphingomyelin phosphodiesterase [Pseudoalteromonas luteoviolacea]
MKLQLLSLAAAMVSSSVLADSDIYLTNNSDQILNISVEHTGSDLMEYGDEWSQHVTQLQPYESKMVLSFNRYYGAKSGHTYQFKTKVTTQSGEVVNLQQNMKGTWYGSTITHSAHGQGFSSAKFSDRNIHRYQSNMDISSHPVEVAFKAKSTARYDDFYYTITPNQLDEASEPAPEQLKVMTYNIWALPVIASHISDRMALLPEYLKGYDALLLQEVFHAQREDFLQQISAEYPYQTRMLDKPGVNIYDGGVTIVSRYPIVNQAQYVFPDCSSTDCFADKGVNYAEIIKNGEAYHLFATHTASSDTDTARQHRQLQFKQIRNLAISLNIPQNETVVYGGDFNVNKLKFPGDYANMLTNLAASAPQYTGYTSSTFDPRVNAFAKKAGETVEYLDYIVVSDEYKAVSNNTNEVKVPRSTHQSIWEHWDLSDHFPVKAVIK